MKPKNCEYCSMPMQSESDFEASNLKNKYYIYCTDKKGNLISMKEEFTDFKGFFLKTNDISEDEAIIVNRIY